MFQDFAKRKLNDYLGLLEFPENKINFDIVRQSALPSYIVNFVDNFLPDKSSPVRKNDFEELLRKALIFNINYVIRPKYSILKFLFGEVETRPAEYIHKRLRYFPFYGYYINQISDFININNLEVVSSAHIERVLDEVNRKIQEEISDHTGNYSNRLNLVKLLYYFFIDLGDNNPINIKLPKKILSVYFADKGFMAIKQRIDNFFSEEVFIQEAIELMTPAVPKTEKRKTSPDVSESQVKEILSKAKGRLINRESSKSEIEKILKAHETPPVITENENISELRETESALTEFGNKEIVLDDKVYSDDLINAADFNSPAVFVPESEDDKREKLINDLFCEETYRKNIIRKLFSKEEKKFREFTGSLLAQRSWQEAVDSIEEYFNKNRVDYYSEEAVKFVDIMELHFASGNDSAKEVKAV